jgi:hypothetical protein
VPGAAAISDSEGLRLPIGVPLSFPVREKDADVNNKIDHQE